MEQSYAVAGCTL